jgi:hypothetical protein
MIRGWSIHSLDPLYLPRTASLAPQQPRAAFHSHTTRTHTEYRTCYPIRHLIFTLPSSPHLSILLLSTLTYPKVTQCSLFVPLPELNGW